PPPASPAPRAGPECASPWGHPRRKGPATLAAARVAQREAQAPRSGADAYPLGFQVGHRAHFHRAVARPRELLGQFDRVFQRIGLDQVVAGEHFLGLREGTVVDPGLAITYPHRAHGRRRLQLVGAKQDPDGDVFVGLAHAVAHVVVVVLRRQLPQQVLVDVHQQEELHATPPWMAGMWRGPAQAGPASAPPCRSGSGSGSPSSTKSSDTELMQSRSWDGGGPSGNTWPRWPPQRAHTISVRIMPWLVSRMRVMCSSS